MTTAFQKHTLRTAALITAMLVAVLIVGVASVLLIAPVRDKFFNANVWPWPLSSDITPGEIRQVEALARPGDIVVESNLHYWQWVALSQITTGSTWVHTSIVNYDGKLLTMDSSDVKVPFKIFLKWNSTRLALVRPTYSSNAARARALTWARSQLGTPYDPSFKNPAGSCTGLVGTALQKGGISISQTVVSGHRIYSAEAFLHAPGSRIIWTSRKK